MISKRIIAVLTFDNGILTRTQNFEADYAYTQNFVNNTLFDGIVLIDISKNNKNRNKFYRIVENFAKNVLFLFVLGEKLNLYPK